MLYQEMKRQNILAIFILLASSLILFSCYMFFPADGAFKVYGTIQSDDGAPLENCSLELHNKKGLYFNQKQPIGSELNARFTVAPYKANYWLKISCQGYKTETIPVHYGENAAPMKPLNIGNIVMKYEK